MKDNKRPFVSGSVASFTSCILLQPFDVVKTRIQESKQHTPLPKLLSAMNREGLRTYWRGLAPTVIRNVPGTGLYFTILTRLKALTQNESSMAGNLGIGAASRVIAGMIMMPFTVMKVQMESLKYHNLSLHNLITQTWKREGVKGFFKGSAVTMMRDAPSSGLYFAFYEGTKGLVPIDTVMNHASLSGTLLSSAATHPFDALKTRVQLTSGQSGLSTCLQELFKTGNFSLLFKGFGVRVARKGINSLIVWVLYEKFSRIE